MSVVYHILEFVSALLTAWFTTQVFWEAQNTIFSDLVMSWFPAKSKKTLKESTAIKLGIISILLTFCVFTYSAVVLASFWGVLQ